MPDFLPSSPPTTILVATTATALLIAIPTIKLVRLHARLSTLVSHESHAGVTAHQYVRSLSSSPADKSQDASVLPQGLLTDPSSFRIVHDTASLAIPASQLPPQFSLQQMLVTYLRHNMTLFSRLPQAYAIYLITPRGHRRTFDRSHIESLAFEKGDIVNGLYRVFSDQAVDHRTADNGISGDLGGSEHENTRNGWRIAMSMKDAEVEGRMVFSVCTKRDGRSGAHSLTTFSTDTYMWLPHNSKAVMPLERRIPRWGHELTSWWLLERGTTHLQELRQGQFAEGNRKQM